jgi:hypothetical protein
LRLITYPNLYPTTQHESCLDSLASEVRALIEEMASSNRPYHNQWKLLTSALKQPAQKHWIVLALRLGRLDDPTRDLSLAELLCVDAAYELLMSFSEKSKGKGLGLQGVEEVVGMWKGCGEEEVRRMGGRVAALL